MSTTHAKREEGVDLVLAGLRDFINARPMLLSLLYDIDMLPEQTVTFAGARRLAGLCEVWKKGEAGELATTKWKPIATAPTDGTRVLVWSEAHTWRPVDVAYWGRNSPINPLGWMGGHCHVNHIDQPTHWQPLPSPPSSLPTTTGKEAIA